MPVIGFLRSQSFGAARHQAAGFRQGLKESGFVEGQSVVGKVDSRKLGRAASLIDDRHRRRRYDPSATPRI
jgi:hypothetical protein